MAFALRALAFGRCTTTTTTTTPTPSPLYRSHAAGVPATILWPSWPGEGSSPGSWRLQRRSGSARSAPVRLYSSRSCCSNSKSKIVATVSCTRPSLPYDLPTWKTDQNAGIAHLCQKMNLHAHVTREDPVHATRVVRIGRNSKTDESQPDP